VQTERATVNNLFQISVFWNDHAEAYKAGLFFSALI